MKKPICLLFLLKVSFISFGQATSQSCHDDLFAKQAQNKFWGYVDLFEEWRVEPVFTKVYPFTGNKAVVEKYGRYGVANCEGRLIIPAEYEEIGPLTFSQSFWAKKTGKWALVNEKGELNVPGAIAEIKEVGFNSEATWLKLQDETYGLYDKRTLRYLAAPRYTMFQIISEKASIVQYKEKFGVISNLDGSYLFEPVITSLKKLSPNVIVFQEKGKWGIMNKEGIVKKIAELDSIGFILNNLYYASKNGKCGLIDANGREVLVMDYDEIQPFHEHMARIKRNGAYGYTTLGGRVTVPVMYEWGDVFQHDQTIVKANESYFLVDKQNKRITQQNYKWLIKTSSRDYYAAHRNGRYLFLDLMGKEMTAPKFKTIIATDTNKFVRVQNDSTKLWQYYDVTKNDFSFTNLSFEEANAFKWGYAVTKTNEKWGIIDEKGNEIIAPKYDKVQLLSNNSQVFFLVNEKEKYGLLNASGNIVLSPEYELITTSNSNLLKVKKAGKYSIVNTKGEEALKTKYDYISNSEEQPNLPSWPAIVRKKNKLGLLDQYLNEIVEPSFESIEYLGDNLYASTLKGKKGILAANGKILASNYLEEVLPESEKYLPCKQNGKWGYLFINGKMMIQPQYEEVGNFYKNLALVKMEGKWGVINKQGRWILKNEFDSVGYLPNGKRKLFSPNRTIEISEKGIVKQLD